MSKSREDKIADLIRSHVNIDRRAGAFFLTGVEEAARAIARLERVAKRARPNKRKQK